MRSGHLLVFTHRDVPLELAGVQVPAGNIKPDEKPEEAALREATEKRVSAISESSAKLGETGYDINPYRPEIMRRHFYELTTDSDPRPPWVAGEPDPEGGGEAPTWDCRWIPLEEAHVLAAGLSVMLGALTEP